MALINFAINKFHAFTCVRFRPKTEVDENYVYISKDKEGCFSDVGNKRMGKQQINFEKPCFNAAGTLIHELMHTVGFYHEHSRYDRDDYVEIFLNNVEPKNKYNFYKITQDSTDDFGTKYDYDSIMHYPRKAFTVNGLDTIVPKQPDAQIGQRGTLSSTDIYKINAMYKCNM